MTYSKIKILFFSRQIGIGGQERQMLYIARGLKKYGYNISIFSIEYPKGDSFLKEYLNIGIKIYFCEQSKKKSSFFRLLKIYRHLLVNKYDFIHSFSANYLIGIVLLFLPNLKYIVSERALGSWRNLNHRILD